MPAHAAQRSVKWSSAWKSEETPETLSWQALKWVNDATKIFMIYSSVQDFNEWRVVEDVRFFWSIRWELREERSLDDSCLHDWWTERWAGFLFIGASVLGVMFRRCCFGDERLQEKWRQSWRSGGFCTIEVLLLWEIKYSPQNLSAVMSQHCFDQHRCLNYPWSQPRFYAACITEQPRIIVLNLFWFGSVSLCDECDRIDLSMAQGFGCGKDDEMNTQIARLYSGISPPT